MNDRENQLSSSGQHTTGPKSLFVVAWGVPSLSNYLHLSRSLKRFRRIRRLLFFSRFFLSPSSPYIKGSIKDLVIAKLNRSTRAAGEVTSSTKVHRPVGSDPGVSDNGKDTSRQTSTSIRFRPISAGSTATSDSPHQTTPKYTWSSPLPSPPPRVSFEFVSSPATESAASTSKMSNFLPSLESFAKVGPVFRLGLQKMLIVRAVGHFRHFCRVINLE